MTVAVRETRMTTSETFNLIDARQPAVGTPPTPYVITTYSHRSLSGWRSILSYSMSLGGQDGGLSLPSTAPIPLSSLSTSSIESVPPSIVSTTHATEPLVSRIPQHNNSLLSDFEQRCATSSLPPPGPEHFEARRNLWLGRPPSGDTTSTLRPQKSPPVSNARSRLEELLSRPGALESDEVWNAGLVRVWKGLVGGGRLKKALPLNLVVCIMLPLRVLHWHS